MHFFLLVSGFFRTSFLLYLLYASSLLLRHGQDFLVFAVLCYIFMFTECASIKKGPFKLFIIIFYVSLIVHAVCCP